MSDDNNTEITWWDKRTKLEKRMFLWTGVAFVVITIIFITFAIIIKKQHKELQLEFSENTTLSTEDELSEDNPICLSPACIKAASQILNSIDPSIDPCDNFYEFACGGFLQSTIIPENKPKVSLIERISELTKVQLKTILERPIIPEEPNVFKVSKRLYYLCMDTSGIEADGFKPINNILKNLDGWPVLEGDALNGKNYSWTKILSKFREIGLTVEAFLSIHVEGGGKEHIKIKEPILSLPKSTLLKNFNDAHVQVYYHYMVDIAVALGADRTYAQHELRKVIQFEIELAKISSPGKSSRKIVTISELQKSFPDVPWLEFLNIFMGVQDFKLNPIKTVVMDDFFVKNLFKLLKRVDKRIQANYAVWKAVSSLIPFLTKQLRERQAEFLQEIEIWPIEQQPRLNECIEIVSSRLDQAVTSMYVRNYFQKDTTGNLTEMIIEIQGHLLTLLEKTPWMDRPTKQVALEKLQALEINVVPNLDQLYDDGKMNELYKNLDAEYDSYLTLILNIQRFQISTNIWNLDKNVEIVKPKFELAENEDLDRFLNLHKNSIDVPVFYLQDILYDLERPNYMNYGAIGHIIGREFVHGYDEIGKYFDKEGSWNKWWSNKTEENFHKISKCVIEQYGKVTEPKLKLKLNGTRTMTENIADVTGLNLAYAAYNSWSERNPRDPHLPGLNSYTPKQLFWISAATIFCEKQSIESLHRQILNNIYSPSNYRVQIPFANLPQFSSDFNCPKGSVMNPNNKCKIF